MTQLLHALFVESIFKGQRDVQTHSGQILILINRFFPNHLFSLSVCVCVCFLCTLSHTHMFIDIFKLLSYPKALNN